MKKRKIIIIILVVLVVLCAGVTIARDFLEDGSTGYKVLNIISVSSFSLCIALLFMVCILILINGLKDRKIFKMAIEQKDYTEAIARFSFRAENAFGAGYRLNAKYTLLTLYYFAGEIEKSQKLVRETEWCRYKNDIYYFLALAELFDGNVAQAEIDYEKLKKQNTKKFYNQVKMLERILSVVKTNDFDDMFYLNSSFPIVKEIYKKYKDKNDNEKTE